MPSFDHDRFQPEAYGPEEVPYHRESEPEEENGLNQWLLAITLVLIIVVGVSVAYTVHEQGAAQRMAQANNKLAADLTQTQVQLEALRSKLKDLSRPQLEPPIPADESWTGAAPPAALPAVNHARRAAALPEPANWQNRFQRQLSDQGRRLSAAEQSTATTQANLAGLAATTQASLSKMGDAIAKSHAQLVGLEELGTRQYYEFDLKKSKKFVREGPISVALRRTSVKHHNYDVDLLVDDFKLTRKGVDLYEPLVFETVKNPRPLELVVNRIGKNEVHGYISAPKDYEHRTSSTAARASGGAISSPQASVTSPNPVQVFSQVQK